MKYFIITYGCQMNESDSEKIAVLLQQQGHMPAKNETDANLIVLNCCSVRQAAMHRVYDKINKYAGKKKIILAGCVLEKDKNMLKEKVWQIWHPDKYFRCPAVSLRSAPPRGGALKQSCSHTAVHEIATLPPVARNDATPIYVPIMTGCNNFCSYCAVPYTRGREKSRHAEKIISEVKSLIENGAEEIMLLGQNVNSYRNPKSKFQNNDFVELLKELVKAQGDFKISFMSPHP